MNRKEAAIAVIGGSGLYEMEGLTNVDFIDIDTPFGKPSDAIVVGSLEGTPVAFLPRHGRGHRLNPSHIPARANIYALKTLGVRRIISVSAVGSLREEYAPLDLAIPNQLIDRTRQRANTFFDEGIVVHIGFADPFCPVASRLMESSARELGITVHAGATMLVMEGPAFSTRAESFMYRAWGADIIGMTALPEAKLAIQNLQKNVSNSKEMLRTVIPQLNGESDCSCSSALKDTIITHPQGIAEELKNKLAPLVGRYLA